MNTERIAKLAKEAGIESVIGNGRSCGTLLKTFARLVAESEREECANLCDDLAHKWRGANSQILDCAAAIRARSNATVSRRAEAADESAADPLSA